MEITFHQIIQTMSSLSDLSIFFILFIIWGSITGASLMICFLIVILFFINKHFIIPVKSLWRFHDK